MRGWTFQLIGILCVFSLLGCGTTRCDPHKRTSIRNIACQKEWEKQVLEKEIKEAILRSIRIDLEKDYHELQIDKHEMLHELSILQGELDEIQNRKEFYLNELESRRLYNHEISELIAQINRVLEHTEKIERISPRIRDIYGYNDTISELKKEKTILEKFLTVAEGYVKDEIVVRGIKFLLPKVLKGIGGRFMTVISTFRTIRDIYNEFIRN